MLHRPPRKPPSPVDEARRRKRERKSKAQRRWRRNTREGKRVARVPVDAAILCWLQQHYPGQCDLDDLDDIGRLLGAILETSARSDV